MAGRSRQAVSWPVSECDGIQIKAGGAKNVLLVNTMASGDGGQGQTAGVDNLLSIIATAHVTCIDTTSYICKRQYSAPSNLMATVNELLCSEIQPHLSENKIDVPMVSRQDFNSRAPRFLRDPSNWNLPSKSLYIYHISDINCRSFCTYDGKGGQLTV